MGQWHIHEQKNKRDVIFFINVKIEMFKTNKITVGL